MISFLSIVSCLIVICAAIYLRQILFFTKGLSRLLQGTNKEPYSVVVIVAARNEEKHIEQCLQSLLEQNYPAEKYRIIVVDDHSTDRTAEIVEQLARRNRSLQLLRLEGALTDVSPKINALNEGIKKSSSDIIVTTDADCTVGPRWITSIINYFEKKVGVVSGVTLFENRESISPFLFSFQSIDFFSQTACGAGAIGMKTVNNCNGSNMAFRRSAFQEVGGYSSIARVNSGSDSLLAQNIVTTTHWLMRFAFEPDSHVVTTPVRSWRDLLQQRMRWAGQTPHYSAATVIFLVASFLLYLLLFLTLPFSIIYFPNVPVPLLILAIKIYIDYRIITRFITLTKADTGMKYFWLSELIHFPVILIAVVGSFFGSFEWKGRLMEREISQHT